MPVWGPKVVDNWSQWRTQGSTNSTIERVMDNSAYTSAHPDDTLVLAGPPRLSAYSGDTADTNESMLDGCFAVGMLQNIAVSQSKPFQPMMAIGSSRTFYLGGKAQGTAQIGRLFLNTDNLLKRMYKYHIDTNKVDPAAFTTSGENPAGVGINKNYLINLDSEFFLIPFGLGVVFLNKAREAIGGFYMEMAVIPNYSVSIAAGQAMIMEGVTVLFDRLLPLPVKEDRVAEFGKAVKASDYPDYNAVNDPNGG